MSAKKRVMKLGIQFNPQEMRAIRRGLVPGQQEDKWFIYYENGILHMHRSWTGNCIYRVRFEEIDGIWTATTAEVNCDRAVYRVHDDPHEKRLLESLVRILLLRENRRIPSEGAGPDKDILSQWSTLGRALFQANESDEEG